MSGKWSGESGHTRLCVVVNLCQKNTMWAQFGKGKRGRIRWRPYLLVKPDSKPVGEIVMWWGLQTIRSVGPISAVDSALDF